MEKLGLLGKMPEKEELLTVEGLYQDISYAYSNTFLPTVLFDRNFVIGKVKSAKEKLKRLV
jgi:hypothetical protein